MDIKHMYLQIKKDIIQGINILETFVHDEPQ